MKWPFVSRKKYKAELATKDRRIANLQATSLLMDEDIERLLKPMVEKFQQTEIRHDPDGSGKYAVQVTFDTNWIEGCLLRGNSQKEIHYLSEMMGKQIMWEVEHLIRARNIVRV